MNQKLTDKDTDQYSNQDLGVERQIVPEGKEFRVEDLKDEAEQGDINIRQSEGLKNKTLSQAGLIIILICLVSANFGAHVFFDTQQLLEDYFLIHFGIQPKTVVQMYTVFHIFAVPTGLVCGLIIAWISPLLSALIFNLLIVLASLFAVYGVYTNNFFWMMVSRAFLGFGAEANEIAQYTLISIWFQGKFLSIASGLGQFANNLGITLSMLYTSRIFTLTRSMLDVYSIVGLCCVLSLLLLVVFSYYDIKFGRPQSTNGGGSSINHHGDKVDCKSWKYLNSKMVWYNILNTWFSQHVYYAFSTWITNLLTKRFQFLLEDSTFYQALVPISVMIGIPFWSAIAVKKGKKMTLMIGAYILAILCFLTIYLMPAERTPLVSIPLFLIGQFMAIQASCTWSSVCLTAQAKGTSLALGLVQFGIGLVGAILAEVFSHVLKDQKVSQFDTACLIMIGLCLLGGVFAVLSLIEDTRIGGLLEYPENSLRVIILKQMIDKDELEDTIREYEEKYKGDPKMKKKVRMDLSRKIELMAQKLRTSRGGTYKRGDMDK